MDLTDALSGALFLRCKREDKAQWVKAASGGKLSRWVIETLNEAAVFDLKAVGENPEIPSHD